jgi:hypothetical protein
MNLGEREKREKRKEKSPIGALPIDREERWVLTLS